MDNGNIEDEKPKGLYCRELLACDHVGMNYLVLAGTRNFYSQGPCYIVFEENLCKVVCPQCFVTGSSRESLKH